MFRWQSEGFHPLTQFSGFGQRFLKSNARAGRIASGDECAARRGAHRRSRISIDETNALGRKPIEVRGLIIRTTVATQITIAKIVGENEKNVWLICLMFALTCMA